MRRLLVIAALAAPAALPGPAAAQDWCDASALNAAERAICLDPILGDLDAEMTGLWASEARTPRDRRDQNAWRTGTRDTCGSDVLCLEEAYHSRIDQLAGAGVPMRRPWCGSGGLSAAEVAVCSDDTLADLDAAMAAVYGATRASDADREQLDWLRIERDACGPDRACLGAAYLSRITVLGGRLRGR